MENLHPLVIGIYNQKHYDDLQNIIHGISFIKDWGINEVIGDDTSAYKRRVKSDNAKYLLSLLPVITIPKGTLIFHSNKYTCDSLLETSTNLNANQGLYEPKDSCHGCRINRASIPYENVGDSPRINELAYNPNAKEGKNCRCFYGRQNRMYANFNFSGNYDIEVHAKMRGTQIYIVTHEMRLLDTTTPSIELGYAIKNDSDIGELDTFRTYCIENGLDGMTMFDTVDKQPISRTDGEGINKSVQNSCYKYEETILCPELVLLHNNDDELWKKYEHSHQDLIKNIGTKKLKIMGMVDLVDNQGNKVSRERVSQMIDLVFSRYMQSIHLFNQQAHQVNKINSLTIRYTITNIYKVLVCNNGTAQDQKTMFTYIKQLWPYMSRNSDFNVFIKANDQSIRTDYPVSFFDHDKKRDYLPDRIVKPWIQIHSNLINNFPHNFFPYSSDQSNYASENIWHRIFFSTSKPINEIYKLYVISCLKIIPPLQDAYSFDIIDFLVKPNNTEELNTIYNKVKDYIIESYIKFIIDRHTTICSKIHIANIFSDASHSETVRQYILHNTFLKRDFSVFKQFLLNQYLSLFVRDEDLDLLLRNIWTNDFKSVYYNQIKTIIRDHYIQNIGRFINQSFNQQIITDQNIGLIINAFEIKSEQLKDENFNIIFSLYRADLFDNQDFSERIDKISIDFIKLFWDVCTEYIVTVQPQLQITKEIMDNLFISNQQNIIQINTNPNGYSPLYNEENIVYKYSKKKMSFIPINIKYL